VAQYKDRAKMDQTELQGLVEFAGKLRGDAEMLQQQISAAKLSGHANGKFGAAAVSSLEHVFPDQFGFAGIQAARLDACRNETESAQVVVLPFC